MYNIYIFVDNLCLELFIHAVFGSGIASVKPFHSDWTTDFEYTFIF